MQRKVTTGAQKDFRSYLLNKDGAGSAAETGDYAGQIIGSLYRCTSCAGWWASSAGHDLEAQLLCLVEPHTQDYLWHHFLGWYGVEGALTCSGCGHETGAAEATLRCDALGDVIWPEVTLAAADVSEDALPAVDDNPFLAYISGSAMIAENVSFIAAHENGRQAHAEGYTADIEDIREKMDEQRRAFKAITAGYAPLLPPGWRVLADYDKWLTGVACAGFLHGEMQPDASMLIGGACHSVAELELELDRLFRYVCELNC